MRRLHRLLLAAVVVVVAVLASGCELTGTLDLSRTDVAHLEVAVTPEGWECSETGWEELGVTVVESSGDSGSTVCQVVGDVDIAKLFNYLPGSAFTPTAMGYLLVLNLQAYGSTTTKADLTVTMPGLIWHASAGEVSGNQVHLGTAADLATTRLIVESVDPVRVWIPLAGLAAVLALIGGAFWLGRRSKRQPPAVPFENDPSSPSAEAIPTEATLVPTDLSGSQAPTAAQESDNSVWMPPTS